LRTMKTLSNTYSLLAFVLILSVSVSSIAQEDIDALALQETRGGITELLDEIKSRDKALAEKDDEIVELKAVLESQSEDTTDADSADELLGSVAQRDEAIQALNPAALESTERIRVLEETLSASQDSLALVQQELEIKNNEIAQLKVMLAQTQESTQKDRLILAYNIGCIYKAGRQYTQSEGEFLKALGIAPDDPGTHYNLGMLYDDNLGNAKKASHHYQRFLELAPNDADAPNVVEWMKALQ
jgi:tetratricopeptide (TPR) repeat protein